ncbi:DUF4114 domain-containing protein [Reyranella sp.]|uniref:DUF4114 domain-containing protein n=3 Tax=Reyranella sp. TaxID=1929291 RepID=UPI003D0D7BDB
MATTYQPIANSTYLDYAGYRITDAPTVESAYGITDGKISPYGINVALVLPRVTDAAGLLAQDWGTRQQTLQELNGKGTLWTTYGASQAQYDALVSAVESAPFDLQVLHDNPDNGNYVSSAESRTIWVHIPDAAHFQTLFDTELMYSQGLIYWNGELSLPSGWNVTGLWVDYETAPNGTNLSTGSPVTLTEGAQGIGNSTTGNTARDPQHIADLYNFPLNGETVQTGTIGLIEPGIGSALKNDQPGTEFQSRLDEYLKHIKVSGGTGIVHVQGGDGQAYTIDGKVNVDAGERSLDVGVVAAINPKSDVWLFNGSGNNGTAYASTYTAIQSSIWEQLAAPEGNTWSKAPVTSNSYGDSQSMAPDSPFYRAYWELFVDAALSNQTTVIALGDGGSGNQTANGLTNVEYNVTQPWNILVGGTSLSTTEKAGEDPTLSAIVASATAGNLATIWQLVAGGLTSLPTDASDEQAFVEAVWNTYYVSTDKSGQPVIEGIPGSGYSASYQNNSTGSGGVDPTQPVPWYQAAYGLNPTTSDSQHLVGRGVPDVSAAAGGNLTYNAPDENMIGTGGNEGTSAAAPLWASLIVQIDTIFQDQLLPNLGYMNDLLYAAAKIAPAAFNDVTLGNNTSSYFLPGDYLTGGQHVSPTGYGYVAGPDYDLATGLGSPNGLLLARALTAIAHSEMSFDDSVPQVLNSYGAGDWTSGALQSLLIQAVSDGALTVGVTAGSTSAVLASAGTDAFAWDARFAGQSQQSDFQSDLVTLFDMQGQGGLGQVTLDLGDTFAISIDGVDAQAVTAPLTNQFGFVDFETAAGLVRVARPVAVAETVNALDDQTAVVNIRQNGADSLAVTFYRVDDFAGSIGGVAPGAAGYEAAAEARAYQTTGGATAIAGPGYGEYVQAMLQDVDAGDIIAMKLADTTQGRTYWAFAQANERVDGTPVGHIWNYGLNTWGFEDTYGGGDHDYNDLVVNIDFTSAYGNAWLV